MDEIFQPRNFVANIAVKSSTPSGIKTAHKDKKIIKQKDTILVYKKEYMLLTPQYTPRVTWDSHYSEFLIKEGGEWKFRKLIDVLKENNFPYNKVEEINPSDEKIRDFIVKHSENIVRLQSHKNKEIDNLSRTKYKDVVYEHIENNKINGLYYNGQVITPISQGIKKSLLGKSIKDYWSILLCDFWSDIDFQNTQNEGGVSLTNGKKPESLLYRVIKLTTTTDDIVLDFNLGSGTTCAVAHKMGRQTIGIEQMNYIEDIAVKRMQKVIGEKVKKDGELLESVDFDNGGISKAINWQGGGEFIYFELDKYNQKYIDNLNAIKQGHGSKKTIEQLYDEIAEQAFLNYDVESDKLKENKADFKKLSLNEQLEFLFSILNKNQLYKNLSEIDDKDLLVDDKTKALNNDFYNG
jgi:adenine-specific DNA-methyltransferase